MHFKQFNYNPQKMKNIVFTFLNLLFFSSLFAQYPPNTVWLPVMPDELPEPAYLESVTDTNYDISFTRISDSDAFGFPVGAGELMPPYAKIQAWNADMSKIAIGFTNILNAGDYSLYKNITDAYPSGFFTDGRWSNVNPEIRYFCDDDQFLKINIESEEVTLLHTFPGYMTTIGPWEGNISADDKYVVITNEASDKAILYDIELDDEISFKNFATPGFDWVSITPSGDYIAVSNNLTQNIELYDLDFNFLRVLTNGQEHADFAVDTAGNEVLVQVIPLSMTRLSDGVSIDLLTDAEVCGNYHYDPWIAGHISGRNFNQPGWALVSTQIHECSNGLGWNYITEMFAIKLDGSGTIKHFGHARTTCTSYDSYSKATISPDGTKVIFGSDWNLDGNGNSDVYAYVAYYDDPSASIYDDTIEKISIFPNPTQESFKIFTHNQSIKTVVIFNSLGINIKTISYKKNQKIDISNLNNGVYFIGFLDQYKNSLFISRLVKM
jgi:hypothetical protein